jgi:hypothetical protein
MRTEVWKGTLGERAHLEDLGIGWEDNIEIYLKLVGEAWIGLIRLKIGSSG